MFCLAVSRNEPQFTTQKHFQTRSEQYKLKICVVRGLQGERHNRVRVFQLNGPDSLKYDSAVLWSLPLVHLSVPVFR